MAVEAARDALKAAPPGDVQALIFATTTPPYAEKLSAAVIGAAAQLPGGDSRLGYDRLGPRRHVGDSARRRRGQRRRETRARRDWRLPSRRARGQGRADHRRRRSRLRARRRQRRSPKSRRAHRSPASSSTPGARQGERFAHSWEERFTLTQAHSPLLGTVIKNVLEKAKVAPTDLSKIILDAPNARAADEIARALKIDPQRCLRLLCVDRRTDRRRARGPDALRGAALCQTR